MEEREVCVRDRPRPLASREEIVPLCVALLEFEAGGDLVPFCPGLPGPPPPPLLPKELVRISLNALAPKLVRRAKGELGAPLFEPVWAELSSSAIADSSALPLFWEPMLPRRPRKELKGEVWFGEPDRPSVVRDIRRP